MTLIKSISGIRGTIGGNIGENLTPVDVVKFTTAFATFLLEKRDPNAEGHMRMVVGRDARISGDIVNRLVCSTLQSMGIVIRQDSEEFQNEYRRILETTDATEQQAKAQAILNTPYSLGW